MFRNIQAQRVIATVVLTTFTSLTMYPLTATASTKAALEKAGFLPKQKQQSVADNVSQYLGKLAGTAASPVRADTDERFSQLLASIHDDLKAITPQTALSKEARRYWQEAHAYGNSGSHTDKKKGKMETRAIGPNMRIETEHTDAPIKPLPGTDITAHVKAIRNKALEVRALYPQIEQNFDGTEKHLKEAGLPQEILDREQQAKDQFEARKDEFDRLMSKLEQARNSTDQQTAFAELGAFMAKYPNSQRHQYTDPNKLPFRAPTGKMRAPMTSKGQLASLFPPKYEPLQVASLSLDGLQLAQATLPDTPNAADLAESDEVQITQAIKDQAQALNNNPVQIYNWVRNNIEFIPSYGSIQGSDMTLQNKRGNAFDTASLLIALYRAAGVPARYVYGTIEVPADKVMNWVGGVTKPEAAQSLLGQGGIPSAGIIEGGTIKSFQMEHVWVKVYVDATPSRGAVNKHPNTWLPVDASFKQHQFIQGMNIKDNVPIDSHALMTQIQQGAAIDTINGYVQNLNTGNLQTQLANYQNQVQNYINGQKANATTDDVLGTQKVIAQNHPILPGTLPYQTVVVANSFQSIPDNLKWKFKTNIYPDDGFSDSSSPIIEINQPTAKLAGKKITLSFVPATQADRDLISSYLPKPHADGTAIQPSDLPTSLPGYLLRVNAELRIDGQTVARTTTAFTMGSHVKQASQYFNPSKGAWDGGDDNDIIVGDYSAIGTDLQGIGPEQIKAQLKKLEATKAKISHFQQHPSDTTPIEGISREELTGDLTYSGILGYFAQVDRSDRLIAKTVGNVVSYRLPSYGTLSATIQAHYFFGVPRSVTAGGLMTDVDYLLHHVEAKNSDHNTRTNYLRLIGTAASAAEHAVPETMFRNPGLPASDPSQPQGVSAVKALAIALGQGQKVYTLSQSNQAIHAAILQSLLVDQDVKSEIANALAAGKEVTVHEKNINMNGWNGSGYLIIDPETGVGAYKISVGFNGAFTTGVQLGILVMLDIVLYAFTLPFAPATAVPAYLAIGILGEIAEAVSVYGDNPDDLSCFWGGFFFGLAGVGMIIGTLLIGPAVALLIGLLGWMIPGIFVPTNTALQCKAFIWQQ